MQFVHEMHKGQTIPVGTGVETVPRRAQNIRIAFCGELLQEGMDAHQFRAVVIIVGGSARKKERRLALQVGKL